MQVKFGANKSCICLPGKGYAADANAYQFVIFCLQQQFPWQVTAYHTWVEVHELHALSIALTAL